MPPLALQLQSPNKRWAKFCLCGTYTARLSLTLMRAPCIHLRAEFDSFPPPPPPRIVRGSDVPSCPYFALLMDECSALAKTITVQILDINAVLISRSISNTMKKKSKINVWQDKICRGKENIILRLQGGYYYKQWRIDKLYLTLLKALDSVPWNEHTAALDTVWLQPVRLPLTRLLSIRSGREQPAEHSWKSCWKALCAEHTHINN